MHERYGPIVRISPYELHIDDIEFYDELYVGASVRRTDKYARSAHAFGGPNAAFGTVKHNRHRVRRGVLNPFFSKRSVAELSPIIQSKICQLLLRLQTFSSTDEPVDLVLTYTALTVDIITEYAFARSMDNLDRPDWGRSWHKLVRDSSKLFHIGKQFPLLIRAMFSLPDSVAQAMNPDLALFGVLRKMMRDNIEELQRTKGPASSGGHRTIFHELLFDSDLLPEDLAMDRLVDEGVSVVVAGSVTVAHTLYRTSFELLNDPSKLAALKDEFYVHTAKNGGEPLTLQQLEQLPYLHATINEGLRMTYGVPHRLLRVAPDVALTFQGWVIPPDTPVGMSAIFIHDNESIFPSPGKFMPERWLGEGKRLEKYLVSFSKGSRQCVGLNLAHAELRLILYSVFGPGGVEMELFETDESDVKVVHDYFNPFPRKDSKGVRVLIK
jgi:cytochrome P450